MSFNAVSPEVEDAGGQDRVRLAVIQGFQEVVGCSGASAGYDRDGHSLGDLPDHIEVVAGLMTVGVHAGDKQFARAEFIGTNSPLERVNPGRESCRRGCKPPSASYHPARGLCRRRFCEHRRV